MGSSEEWEREKAFWAAPGRADTYDKEHCGGYSEASEMVKQKSGVSSEWVRAEDYRRDVEAAEAEVARLKAVIEKAVDMLNAKIKPSKPTMGLVIVPIDPTKIMDVLDPGWEQRRKEASAGPIQAPGAPNGG